MGKETYDHVIEATRKVCGTFAGVGYALSCIVREFLQRAPQYLMNKINMLNLALRNGVQHDETFRSFFKTPCKAFLPVESISVRSPPGSNFPEIRCGWLLR